MRTTLDKISSIQSELNIAYAVTTSGPTPPSLSTYSAVPSLQSVANQHSSAIEGSTGCAKLVVDAISREIDWSASNIKALCDSIRHNEDNNERRLKEFTGHLLEVVDTQYAYNFNSRPEFQVGTLSFQNVFLTDELSLTPVELFNRFKATHDETVVEAIDFWTNTADTMETISNSVRTIAGRLGSEHEGEVFTAASKQLTGLAERILLVSESSGIMADSLSPLPYIRSAGTSNLHRIISQSQMIDDLAERESYARFEMNDYLTGQYLVQLQETIPVLSSLASPHHAGAMRSARTLSTRYIQGFSEEEIPISRSPEFTHAASAPPLSRSASVPAPVPLPPAASPFVSPSNMGVTAPNGVGMIPQSILPQSSLMNPSRPAQTDLGQTRPNSVRSDSSPLMISATPDRRISGTGPLNPDRQNATALNRNSGGPMTNAPTPGRLLENPNTSTRRLGTPLSSVGAGNQMIHGNSPSDKHRALTGVAHRGRYSVTPGSSIGGAARGSFSPIDQVSRSRRDDSTNANHRRLFGSTEPTVPGILGAELRH